MKNYKIFLIGFLFFVQIGNIFSQNLSLSETLQYINEKLSNYPVYNSSTSHNYVDKTQISISGTNLTVTTTDKDLTNGDISTTIFKVNANNLSQNAQINRMMNGANSINIQIDCRARANNVQRIITYPRTSSTNYISSLNISVGTNEENAQYLCNAFNHLIKLINEENKSAATDPFANYDSNQSKKQTPLETKAKNTTPVNVNASISKTPQIYRSNKYGYTITAPPEFKKTEATGRNIDLKLQSNDGSSILINVSPRLPVEMKITGHDYSKELLEESFRQNNTKTYILVAEKTYIADCKAFQIIYTNQSNSNLKALEIYFFRGNYAYVLTATATSAQFGSYESTFKNVFKSLTFY